MDIIVDRTKYKDLPDKDKQTLDLFLKTPDQVVNKFQIKNVREVMKKFVTWKGFGKCYCTIIQINEDIKIFKEILRGV